MTAKQPDVGDINALAMEACDMWQEHLSNLANDPVARAELTRFLEPQRRMFADWTTMMRQGFANHDPSSAKDASPSAAPDGPASGTDSSAPSGVAASSDDPLRVAQLALRLAELERRVGQLESRLSAAPKGT